jgi:DnaD/phage-associated family protein
MKPFDGFPKNAQYTGLPRIFFTELLPNIDDIAELKVTIHLLRTLHEKKGYPRFLTDMELVSDKLLMKGVGDEDAVRRGLNLAASRGTILQLTLKYDGKPVALYFLNTEGDRDVHGKIERGEIQIEGFSLKEPGYDTGERPNIFALYEQNIGMLTPMIGEELIEAEKIYPASWLEDAFKEAVSMNKRNWRYIEAILKRWESEGRSHGELGRDSEADPDKYVKQKYGHLFRRRID